MYNVKVMINVRKDLLQKIWDTQDAAYDLMLEYDSIPHRYGDEMLYQAEGHMIDLIAANPGITATDLSEILNKTVSACSQIIRKLRKKGWVRQVRNPENNRVYNLTLTDSGVALFKAHEAFSLNCQEKTFHMLEEFTEDELRIHLKVQQMLNIAYQEDVRRSKEQNN